MLGVDPDIGSSALRLVGRGRIGGVAGFRLRLAFNWSRTRTWRASAWSWSAPCSARRWPGPFSTRAGVRDQGAERRALELRATELSAQALAPGSPLACLDGWPAKRRGGVREGAVCFARNGGRGNVLTSRRGWRCSRTWWPISSAAAATIDGVLLPLRRSLESRPLRLRRACARGARRLHQRELQGAGAACTIRAGCAPI